jgi:hypothetical protein
MSLDRSKTGLIMGINSRLHRRLFHGESPRIVLCVQGVLLFVVAKFGKQVSKGSIGPQLQG